MNGDLFLWVVCFLCWLNSSDWLGVVENVLCGLSTLLLELLSSREFLYVFPVWVASVGLFADVGCLLLLVLIWYGCCCALFFGCDCFLFFQVGLGKSSGDRIGTVG